MQISRLIRWYKRIFLLGNNIFAMLNGALKTISIIFGHVGHWNVPHLYVNLFSKKCSLQKHYNSGYNPSLFCLFATL